MERLIRWYMIRFRPDTYVGLLYADIETYIALARESADKYNNKRQGLHVIDLYSYVDVCRATIKMFKETKLGRVISFLNRYDSKLKQLSKGVTW